MERATALIANKGYDWKTANDIAITCFENAKRVGMPVEFFIEKIRNINE